MKTHPPRAKGQEKKDQVKDDLDTGKQRGRQQAQQVQAKTGGAPDGSASSASFPTEQQTSQGGPSRWRRNKS